MRREKSWWSGKNSSGGPWGKGWRVQLDRAEPDLYFNDFVANRWIGLDQIRKKKINFQIWCENTTINACTVRWNFFFIYGSKSLISADPQWGCIWPPILFVFSFEVTKSSSFLGKIKTNIFLWKKKLEKIRETCNCDICATLSINSVTKNLSAITIQPLSQVLCWSWVVRQITFVSLKE